jgi:hypothetical protein
MPYKIRTVAENNHDINTTSYPYVLPNWVAFLKNHFKVVLNRPCPDIRLIEVTDTFTGQRLSEDDLAAWPNLPQFTQTAHSNENSVFLLGNSITLRVVPREAQRSDLGSTESTAINNNSELSPIVATSATVPEQLILPLLPPTDAA